MERAFPAAVRISTAIHPATRASFSFDLRSRTAAKAEPSSLALAWRQARLRRNACLSARIGSTRRRRTGQKPGWVAAPGQSTGLQAPTRDMTAAVRVEYLVGSTLSVLRSDSIQPGHNSVQVLTLLLAQYSTAGSTISAGRWAACVEWMRICHALILDFIPLTSGGPLRGLKWYARRSPQTIASAQYQLVKRNGVPDAVCGLHTTFSLLNFLGSNNIAFALSTVPKPISYPVRTLVEVRDRDRYNHTSVAVSKFVSEFRVSVDLLLVRNPRAQHRQHSQRQKTETFDPLVLSACWTDAEPTGLNKLRLSNPAPPVIHERRDAAI